MNQYYLNDDFRVGSALRMLGLSWSSTLLSNLQVPYHVSPIMHDTRFNDMGMALGYASSVWETIPLPTVQKWLHIVAVFRQGQNNYFYVDGTKAPISRNGCNNGGRSDLFLGSAIHNNRHSDCWIEEK